MIKVIKSKIIIYQQAAGEYMTNMKQTFKHIDVEVSP